MQIWNCQVVGSFISFDVFFISLVCWFWFVIELQVVSFSVHLLNIFCFRGLIWCVFVEQLYSMLHLVGFSPDSLHVRLQRHIRCGYSRFWTCLVFRGWHMVVPHFDLLECWSLCCVILVRIWFLTSPWTCWLCSTSLPGGHQVDGYRRPQVSTY